MIRLEPEDSVSLQAGDCTPGANLAAPHCYERRWQIYSGLEERAGQHSRVNAIPRTTTMM